MGKPELAPVGGGPSRALLLTDAGGAVVFADSAFNLLINRFSARAIVREPLYRVMGIDMDAAGLLLRDISRAGQVIGQPLDLHNVLGEAIHVLCNGLATYDERRKFIGADLILTPDGAATAAHVPSSERHAPPGSAEHEAYQAYFQAVVTVLRDLVERIGGKRLGSDLGNILNETARRNSWSFSSNNQAYVVEAGGNEAEVYRALLARAHTYAASIIGDHLVVKGIQKLDSRFSAGALSMIDRAGLRELVM